VNDNEPQDEQKEQGVRTRLILQYLKLGFINALIASTVLIIIWTVLAQFIKGNWLLAWNIGMALLTLLIVYSNSYSFYRSHMAWGWLAFILSLLTWFILLIIVKNIVFLFF
jgi:hypothetical protein